MNFSIPQGHTRSLARLWREEEGVIGVCRCRWEYGRGPKGDIGLCVHHKWWGHFLECKTPINHLPVDNQEQIHSGDICSKRRTLALIYHLASL